MNGEHVHGSILRNLGSMGWMVSVHRMGAYCELHAVRLPDVGDLKIARADGDSDDDLYLAACELAQMCGMDLEGSGRR